MELNGDETGHEAANKNPELNEDETGHEAAIKNPELNEDETGLEAAIKDPEINEDDDPESSRHEETTDQGPVSEELLSRPVFDRIENPEERLQIYT